jgi:hypothetical protein
MTEPTSPIDVLHDLRALAEAQHTSVIARLSKSRVPTATDLAWLLAALRPPTLQGVASVVEAVRTTPPHQLCPPLQDGPLSEVQLHALVAVACEPSLAVHPPWNARITDALFDAQARPEAYRDLSAHALDLLHALDVADHSLAGQLLGEVSAAALFATNREDQARATWTIQRAHRRDTLRAWNDWAASHNVTKLRPALQRAVAGDVALAAADSAPDALARLSLGEAMNGDVTLAIMPDSVLLEWTGDDGATPPSLATLGAATLAQAPTHASLADAAWYAALPTHRELRVTLTRGADIERLSWTDPRSQG